MPSTTIAVMNACEKSAKVTVSMREDGDMDVLIESDCDLVRAYGERLSWISPEDVYGFERSRINSDEIRGNLTPNCIVPNAVYNAAFLEMGLLTKSLAKKSHDNRVILDDKANEQKDR